MSNIYEKKIVENTKHIFYVEQHFLFRKIVSFMGHSRKILMTWQATDDIMAHAHCILDMLYYNHTLRICNTYCFSTAKIVAQMRHNITLYVHCLSFSIELITFLCFYTHKSLINTYRNTGLIYVHVTVLGETGTPLNSRHPIQLWENNPRFSHRERKLPHKLFIRV